VLSLAARSLEEAVACYSRYSLSASPVPADSSGDGCRVKG